MLIEEYKEVCIQFAKETKDWNQLNKYKYYTSNGNSWEESCDNAHGGLDISWAFQMKENKIKELAPQKFVDLIKEEIQTAIDNDLSSDEIGELVNTLLK